MFPNVRFLMQKLTNDMSWLIYSFQVQNKTKKVHSFDTVLLPKKLKFFISSPINFPTTLRLIRDHSIQSFGISKITACQNRFEQKILSQDKDLKHTLKFCKDLAFAILFEILSTYCGITITSCLAAKMSFVIWTLQTFPGLCAIEHKYLSTMTTGKLSPCFLSS